MTQNVNKAMQADETSHWMQRTHKICVWLRHWDNQCRLSSFDIISDIGLSFSIHHLRTA